MIKTLKSMMLAGAIVLVAAPSYAQGMANPLGIDLDPFHIFTPAPKAAKMHRHHAAHHRTMKHKMAMKKHGGMKHMAMKKKGASKKA